VRPSGSSDSRSAPKDVSSASKSVTAERVAAAVDARLVCDVVVLGEPERAALAREDVVVAFQGVQDVEATNFRVDSDAAHATSVVKVDLREVTHPLTALAWVVYDFGDVSFAYKAVPHTATLFLGSQPRFSDSGDVSRLVHRYLRSPSATSAVVHAYPFALDIANAHPNGSMSLSRGDATMRFDFPLSQDRVMVKVFATTTRFLNVARGSARLLFQ
jgi:hypothetical protein